jgi:hypothetical protein
MNQSNKADKNYDNEKLELFDNLNDGGRGKKNPLN